jgi:hypothetical protein
LGFRFVPGNLSEKSRQDAKSVTFSKAKDHLIGLEQDTAATSAVT